MDTDDSVPLAAPMPGRCLDREHFRSQDEPLDWYGWQCTVHSSFVQLLSGANTYFKTSFSMDMDDGAQVTAPTSSCCLEPSPFLIHTEHPAGL